jgi:hypothetical protein
MEAQGGEHLLIAMPCHKSQTVEQFTAPLLQGRGEKGPTFGEGTLRVQAARWLQQMQSPKRCG